MSIEYEERVNPLTAFLHEQAMKAEQDKLREKEEAESVIEETDND